MREIAEIQEIYDSKPTVKEKINFAMSENEKYVKELAALFKNSENKTKLSAIAPLLKCSYVESLSIEDKAIMKKEEKKRIFYKIQKVIDDVILFAVKWFIIDKFLYTTIGNYTTECLASMENPILDTLRCLTASLMTVTLFSCTLFAPFRLYPAFEKLGKSFMKLFS